jgi:arsenate reductase
MQLFGLKSCDTCRKAMKALPDATFIDVRDAGVPDEIMVRAYAKFDAALLNTRSTTWRGLDAAEREKPVLELLAAYPALMKRSLIVTDDQMYLGWGPDVQVDLRTS